VKRKRALLESGKAVVGPLSKFSNVVANIKPSNQVYLYVRPEDVTKAKQVVDEVLKP